MGELDSVKTKLTAALEALLFAYGEPIEVSRIAKIISAHAGLGNVSVSDVEKLEAFLREKLTADDRGLTVITAGNALQLVTKPDFHMVLEGLMKEELSETLSPAALETLAIIAYGGSVPRSTIDYIRGVNSSYIVRNLLLRGLIARIQDPERGNAYRYQPSFELLRHLGISSPAELPEYTKFRESVVKLTGTTH